MANDNVVFYQQPEVLVPGIAAISVLSATLINGATDTDDPTPGGVQLYPLGHNMSVEVTGSADSFSLQLYGSNAQSMPTTNDGWSVLGSAITALGITVVSYPVRWIQARLASISGSDAVVTCNIHSVGP